LADDHLILLEAFRELLEPTWGSPVQQRMALRYWKRHKNSVGMWYVVLIDMAMPLLDGLEVGEN
jgi:CheY-like chemotaxis protein